MRVQECLFLLEIVHGPITCTGRWNTVQLLLRLYCFVDYQLASLFPPRHLSVVHPPSYTTTIILMAVASRLRRCVTTPCACSTHARPDENTQRDISTIPGRHGEQHPPQTRQYATRSRWPAFQLNFFAAICFLVCRSLPRPTSAARLSCSAQVGGSTAQLPRWGAQSFEA